MKRFKKFRIIIISIVLFAFVGCSFTGQEETRIADDPQFTEDDGKNNNAGNPDISEPLVSDDKAEEEPLKEFSFSSEKDLLKLSDEDVIYLATHHYETSYFVQDFHEDAYDDFGTPLVEFERFEPLLLNPGGNRPDYDVNQKMSDEDFNKLAREWLDGYQENSYELDITYYGETENYVEYGYKVSGDFGAGRICFYRNEFMIADTIDGNYYVGPHYLGELTVENVMSEEDFYYSNYFEEYLLLREVEDRDDAIVYICYRPYLKTIGDYGEEGECQKAEIIREEVIYYKDTHSLDSVETVIKSVDIPGTTLSIPNPV
ncbi:MAG: hypothetical protein J6X97_02855 [Lachnospiraceae bacterium]|nr:hypothetical protein [Lachnospiraceae bacterium]